MLLLVSFYSNKISNCSFHNLAGLKPAKICVIAPAFEESEEYLCLMWFFYSVNFPLVS